MNQGFIHHKLPTLYILVPMDISTLHSCVAPGFSHNRDSLVSHFDVHHTLIHLMDMTNNSSCPTIGNQSRKIMLTNLRKVI
jgi:hypothetical protein